MTMVTIVRVHEPRLRVFSALLSLGADLSPNKQQWRGRDRADRWRVAIALMPTQCVLPACPTVGRILGDFFNSPMTAVSAVGLRFLLSYSRSFVRFSGVSRVSELRHPDTAMIGIDRLDHLSGRPVGVSGLSRTAAATWPRRLKRLRMDSVSGFGNFDPERR